MEKKKNDALHVNCIFLTTIFVMGRYKAKLPLNRL